MTTAEFSTVLDSIVAAAFDLATAMPERITNDGGTAWR